MFLLFVQSRDNEIETTFTIRSILVVLFGCRKQFLAGCSEPALTLCTRGLGVVRGEYLVELYRMIGYYIVV